MDAAAIEALPMPATYGRHLARLFDGDTLLAGTGLKPADLEVPDRRITVAQALQYIRNTLAAGAEPDWYLAWAETLTDHFHGPISVALLTAPTLGEGLDAFLRFFPSRIPYMHMQGRYDGDYFLAELCPLIELGEATAMLVETPLVILKQHLDTAYGVNLGETRLHLNYPPTVYVDRYAHYFRCPVRFEAGCNALAIPRRWRELTNLGYLESGWSHAIAQCKATLASTRERETLGEVQLRLCRAFDNAHRRRPLPTLEELSAELHIAPRTLIRRLRRLGTSYQAITDDFLRCRAQALLANDGKSVKEVAGALGFDNPANFGKAFKRWCGMPPGRYRAKQRSDEANASVAP